VNNTREVSMVIGVMAVIIGALVACGTPATPEESCLSTASTLVEERKSDDVWPIAITDVSVINSEPVLCKGTATFDSGTNQIQFSENSEELWFEALPMDQRQCDDFLINLIMELSKEQSLKTGSAEIIKIYNPKEISNTGIKLKCKGEAMLDIGSTAMVQFHVEMDEDEDFFYGYEGL
jgi:hypothetical protein